MIEQLESRTLLSAWAPFSSDPGGSTAAALDLGSLAGLHRYTDSLSAKDRVDVVKFSLADRGNFNVTLSGFKSNIDLQLLNSSGQALATSDAGGKHAERISRFLMNGTYFLRIYPGSGFKSGSYRLAVQGDLNWGKVTNGGNTKNISLVFANDSSQAISRKKETWVLIHGWLAPGRPIALTTLADAVDRNSKADQVLILDWSDAAAQDNVFSAAMWAPAVAQWAANKLASWGISSSKINLIGHSLGALVADQMSSRISGGVNKLIALDPATGIPGTNFSAADFSADSRYSLAFIGSNYGTPAAAATADEAFEMNVGSKDSLLTHSNVVDLFASMVFSSTRKKPDAISKWFDLDSLTSTAKRPFAKNAFDSIYEGVIDGSASGGWHATKFVYKNNAGKTVTVTT